MKDIVIVGSSGHAKEMLFLLEENNREKKQWNILGFIDNERKEAVHGYPIIGNDMYLLQYKYDISAVLGVGSPILKKKIRENLSYNHHILFPNIIANSVIGDFKHIEMGEGCILCAGCVLTTDISLGNYVTLNTSCTIGHDAVIGDYATINPASCVSGNVTIGSCSDIGAGSRIIQGRVVGENVCLGAGAVVIRNIPANCTAVGVPATVIKKREAAVSDIV